METQGPVTNRIAIAFIIGGAVLAGFLTYEGNRLQQEKENGRASVLEMVTQDKAVSPGDTRKGAPVTPAIAPRVAVTLPPPLNETDSPDLTIGSINPGPSVVPSTTQAIPTPTLVPTVSTTTPGATVQEHLSVVINEIAWMGTQYSPSDEWIELYNYGSQVVDLSGWSLQSETDGGPNILFAGKTIGPGQYFVIERTNDNTISDVAAGFAGPFGTGLRNDPGERLVLKDATGTVSDLVDCSGSKWFGGKNDDKTQRLSMERIDPLKPGNLKENWGTNNGLKINGLDAGRNQVLGTPGQANSIQNI